MFLLRRRSSGWTLLESVLFRGRALATFTPAWLQLASNRARKVHFSFKSRRGLYMAEGLAS